MATPLPALLRLCNNVIEGPISSVLLCTETGRAQKSGVLVEMEDLSFHFRSPGDLTDDELEEITNFLSERMNTQEASELHQLHHFYNTLAKYVAVSVPKFRHRMLWLIVPEPLNEFIFWMSMLKN